MKTTARACTFLYVVGSASLIAPAAADAAPGHTSCRALGATTAEEARNHAVAPEVLAFAPRHVDDLIALVQLGGTFEGEPVAPLCVPR
jgi:hypothetical protein